MKKLLCVGLIVVVMVLVLQAFQKENTSPTQNKTPQKKTEAYRPASTPEMQAQRLEFCNKLAEQGIFEKELIYENGVAKVYITNAFVLLSEKDQNSFLEVPYAYLYDTHLPKDVLFFPAMVLKMDNGTPLGKRVGEYSPTNGIKWYK